MKNLIILFLTVLLFSSCKTRYYCTPPKGSKDYAVQQWVKQRSDGYYIVTTIKGFSSRTDKAYECLPDLTELKRLCQ